MMSKILSLGAIVLAILIAASPISVAFYCPLTAYVTSIRGINYKTVDDLNLISLDMQLDYDPTLSFRLENVRHYRTSNRFDTSAAFLSRIQDFDKNFIYRMDSIDKQNIMTTRDEQIKQTKSIIKPNEERSPRDIASDCSKIYIYDADYFVKLDGDKVIHVIYRHSMRCYTITTLSSLTDLSSLVYKAATLDEPDSNIVSASYKYPYLFEFTAMAWINLKIFDEKGKPSESQPLGSPVQSMIFLVSNQMTSNLIGNGPKSMFLTEPTCYNSIQDLALDDYQKDDLYSPYPIRSLTSLPHPSGKIDYITIRLKYGTKPYGENIGLQHQTGTGRQLPLDTLRITPAPNGSLKINNKLSIEAISIAPDKTMSIQRDFPFRKTYLFTYLFNNTKIDEVNGNLIIPDDIFHRVNCGKIVSIYGLTYVTHDIDKNILTDKGIWNYLPDQVETTVEAATSDDRFVWFLMRRTKILKVEIDPRVCQELRIVGPGTFIHFRELTQVPVVQGKPPMREASYVTSNGSLSDGTTTELPASSESSSKTSLLWVYLTVGMIVLALIMVCIMILVLKFSGKGAHGITIYSRSKLSGQDHVVSSMPLMESHMKSVPKAKSLVGISSKTIKSKSPMKKRHKTKTKSKSPAKKSA